MEFLIASKMNGQVIDIRQGGDGGGLVVAPATSSASQRWSLVPAGDGCFYVQNTGSGQVIDICGGDTSLAAPYDLRVRGERRRGGRGRPRLQRPGRDDSGVCERRLMTRVEAAESTH